MGDKRKDFSFEDHVMLELKELKTEVGGLQGAFNKFTIKTAVDVTRLNTEMKLKTGIYSSVVSVGFLLLAEGIRFILGS